MSRFGINAAIQNALTTRTAWLRKLLDPRRDVMAECGHPEIIEVKDYAFSFERGDIANRVVTLFPEESWSTSPAIIENEEEVETEFETKWKEMEDNFRIWSYLQRADILSGIGRFGVLLLGFGDGLDLREEVTGTDNELIYLRPFEENLVDIAEVETDVKNPRFGLPKIYNIRFVDTTTAHGAHETAQAVAVHWTRIIHLADNRQNSDVYGTPRMKPVFNRLLDLRKIAGGSGEMFWKGGFPGIALEANDPDNEVVLDKDATREQMDSYMNGLNRYIALVGMTAKSLAPQVADPSDHVEVQMKLIAATLGVPWRIFIGSEAAQLASSQDMISWNSRINRRREEYISPFIIRPLINRLMDFGPLPLVEEYDIKWEDLNSPTDDEKASVAEKRTNALAKYVQGGIDAVVPPFHYLTIILGMDDEEANAILLEAGDRLVELTPDFDLEQQEKRAKIAADNAPASRPVGRPRNPDNPPKAKDPLKPKQAADVDPTRDNRRG